MERTPGSGALHGRAGARKRARHLASAAALASILCAVPDAAAEAWLAGDHHVHSHFSPDASHPIAENARMARQFGLAWMVTTDHGGPNHSRIKLEQAYPELLRSRTALPDLVQFVGLELNTPGGDHSSLIVPHTPDEAEVLFALEAGYDVRDAVPPDPARDTEPKMIEALKAMRALPVPPVVIANHASRTAAGPGEYGAYSPAELRLWNDTAPEVAVGMAGAPGHQAAALAQNLSDEIVSAIESYFGKSPAAESGRALLPRGLYQGSVTLGGFDAMTARLGGYWDSLLGEGRRWWITANSDFHVHFTEEDGFDFWPGEYSKTYVFAERRAEAVLAGIRAGRMFVTTGDLISELELTASGDGRTARMGEALRVAAGTRVHVDIRLRDPEARNANGENPEVARVDVIVGDVAGPAADRTTDRNDTTRVVLRLREGDWRRDGEYLAMSLPLVADRDRYVRVRGTSTTELEPEPDPPGEDPWNDLWFYSNPVFVTVE